MTLLIKITIIIIIIQGYDVTRIELLRAIFVFLNSLNYFVSPQDDSKYIVMAQM